jgi:hypothetical protein
MEWIAKNSHHGLLEVQVEKKPLQNVRALTGLTVVQFVYVLCNSNAKVEFIAGTGGINSNYYELL